jgi:hypothetical protein
MEPHSTQHPARELSPWGCLLIMSHNALSRSSCLSGGMDCWKHSHRGKTWWDWGAASGCHLYIESGTSIGHCVLERRIYGAGEKEESRNVLIYHYYQWLTADLVLFVLATLGLFLPGGKAFIDQWILIRKGEGCYYTVEAGWGESCLICMELRWSTSTSFWYFLIQLWLSKDKCCDPNVEKILSGFHTLGLGCKLENPLRSAEVGGGY